MDLNIDDISKPPRSINRKHNFKISMNSVEDYARGWVKDEKEEYFRIE